MYTRQHTQLDTVLLQQQSAGTLLSQVLSTFKTICKCSKVLWLALALECLSIPTYATSECKLLTSRRVLDMQWAVCPLEGLGTGSHGTLGEVRFGHTGQTLEVVVAWVAEVSCPKAEVDRNRATIATLVFQEVCAMFRTDLDTDVKEKESSFLWCIH